MQPALAPQSTPAGSDAPPVPRIDDTAGSGRHPAAPAFDELRGIVHDFLHEAAPLLERTSEQASAFARRGADAVRDGSQKLRETAHRASDSTIAYVKDEPVKAMLIAAATGAALMAVICLASRSRERG